MASAVLHILVLCWWDGVDIFTFIDTVIVVASSDSTDELKCQIDAIVQRLYTVTTAPPRCRNCDSNLNVRSDGHRQIEKRSNPCPQRRQLQQHCSDFSPETSQSLENDDDEVDPYGGLFDGEQKKVLEIKEQLEEPEQAEDFLVELLQTLADVDIR